MDDPRLSRRRLLASAGAALSVATAGCALEAPQLESENDPPTSTGFPDEFETPDTDQIPGESELGAVYEQVIDSVAAVRIEDTGGPLPGGGSAWVYQDNYLVTNDHVVELTEEPFVWFDGAGWREASIAGTDFHSDLAVIEVREGLPESATPLPLVSEPAGVGTPVAAIGNPFDLTSSFTTGVISGRNRNIDVPGRDFSIADGIQTDAAVNPGNSGGPLVTHEGEVAGVVSAGIEGERAQNVGFAVSAQMTERVIPALLEDGEFRHSYLGVFLEDVEPGHIEANDLGNVTWGVYVFDTIDGGPAEGILQGSTDTEIVRGSEFPVGGDVIVSMDDQDIPTRERLSAFLALETDPGDTIEIEIVRDGQRQTVDVTLGARDDDTL